MLYAGQLKNLVLTTGIGLDIFHFSEASKLAVGPTQPPVQWLLVAFSLVEKQPGHEADHSPLSSVKVMNAWSYTSTSK